VHTSTLEVLVAESCGESWVVLNKRWIVTPDGCCPFVALGEDTGRDPGLEHLESIPSSSSSRVMLADVVRLVDSP
jgi:hypothetical protein